MGGCCGSHLLPLLLPPHPNPAQETRFRLLRLSNDGGNQAHTPDAWPTVIAVHIRRGDIVKLNQAIRNVPNIAYFRLLQRLLFILQSPDRGRAIRVILCAEGARPPAYIPDIKGGSWMDFSALGSGTPHVEVMLGPTDALRAFHTLCTADVAVGGKSGFSFLAAVLCSGPVHLAFPWKSPAVWTDAIACSGNSLILQETASQELRFDERQFVHLLHDKRHPIKWLPCCPSKM